MSDQQLIQDPARMRVMADVLPQLDDLLPGLRSVEELDLEHLGDLPGEAANQRDEICEMPAWYRRQADVMGRQGTRTASFPWIHGRRALAPIRAPG